MRSRALGALLATIVLSCAAATDAAAFPHGGYATIQPACAPAPRGSASCFALVRTPVGAASAAVPGVRPYAAGAGSYKVGPAEGLTPGDLASAYGFSPTATPKSTQTVAVIDAFDDPNIEEDLATFDKEYSLGECTKADGCFKKVNQEGAETPKPAKDTSGWSEEISLDVETVRAVCQKCKILLVEADNSSYEDLAKAVDEAVSLGATEVSNSYGGGENGMSTEQQDAYHHPGVVITAATGDYGWEDWNVGAEEVNAPSSLPSVVSVGGTSLNLNTSGTRQSESVWNDYGVLDENEIERAGYAAGGGCSELFEAQPWQRDAPGFAASGCGSMRLAADVSADADPLTGFDVYDNYDFCKTAGAKCTVKEEEALKKALESHEDWLTFGGTSLSTPIIAGLYALAGGAGGLEYPSLTLYGHLGGASLYDVTLGGNGLCDGAPESVCGKPDSEFVEELDCEGTSSCDARSGYDGPSGVGTPNGLGAFEPALPQAVVTPPKIVEAGVAATFTAGSSSDPNPGATITGWSWSAGNGQTSTQAAPPFTYAAPGEYTVSLKVTDSYGLVSATAEQKVLVLSEAEAKRLKEEEAAKKKHEEEEAKKKAEEEAAKKKHEEEEAKKKAEEEAARRKHEEEEARRRAEEAARLLAGGAQGVSGFTSSAAAVPDATLAGSSLQVGPGGTLTVKVSCPAGESVCTGTVTLRTLTAVSAGTGRAARRAVLTLASAHFSVAGGRTASVKMTLSSKGRTLLGRAHNHTLRVLAIVAAHDTLGASHTNQGTVTLHAAKTHHGKG